MTKKPMTVKEYKRQLRREMNDAYSALRQVEERLESQINIPLPDGVRGSYASIMTRFEEALEKLRAWWK